MIGKSGNFYWVEKLQRQKSAGREKFNSKLEIQRFGLYDNKLNPVTELIPQNIPGTMKQWLMTGEKTLDQIIVTTVDGWTRIICNRYQANQNTISNQIDSLPYSATASNLLLVRSGDHSKNLLVAFENSNPSFTRIHALMFDSEWNSIYHQVIDKAIFAQPCIQDEEIGFPAESFDNLPIKLADNGEWLMATPSRTSQNFSLFHACSNGSDFYFREIPVSPFYKMEDIAMSIDDENQEMSLALLSGYKNSSLKNVQICNYSLKQGKFEFDSSYHFNTQVRDIRAKNLSNQSFVAVPGGGFMLLKEYGSPFEFEKPVIPVMNNLETAYLLANYHEANMGDENIKPGFTQSPGLSPIPFIRNRGDLNLFYFPAIKTDSTWSGIMELEQHAEINNPDLSYLLVPSGNKIYIIYNSMNGFTDPLATSTTLNKGGQTLDDALIFWKMNKMLNFQRSHRFSETEVAVPYMDPARSGFAIIRLK